MYDVFISCTGTDVKIAERLAAYLKYYNVECFVAHRDIPADVPWAHGIAEAIRNSKIMIALFSEDFNTGVWMISCTDHVAEHSLFTWNSCTDHVTVCVDAGDDAEGKFPAMYEEVCNMLGMPIENALPVEEVLIEKQPETTTVSQETEIAPEKQEADVKKEKSVTKNSARSLLPAIIIGVVLMLVVKLFLDWILEAV